MTQDKTDLLPIVLRDALELDVDRSVAEAAATKDLAVRALLALLDLGHGDVVQAIRREAIAEIGNNIVGTEDLDMDAVHEHGRRHVTQLVATTIAAHRMGVPNPN